MWSQTGSDEIPHCALCGGGLRNRKSENNTDLLTKYYDDNICCGSCGRDLHWVPHHGSHKNAVLPSQVHIPQYSGSLVYQPDPSSEGNQLQGQTTPHLNHPNLLAPAGQQRETQQAATIWQQYYKKTEILRSSYLVLLLLLKMISGCASFPAVSCPGPNYIMHDNGFCCGVVSCNINFTVSKCQVEYGNDTCIRCPEGSFLLDPTTSITATECSKAECEKNKTKPSQTKATEIDPNACPLWCQCDLSFNFCGTDPCNCQHSGCAPQTPSPPKPTPSKAIPVTLRNFTTSQPKVNVPTKSSTLTVDNVNVTTESSTLTVDNTPTDNPNMASTNPSNVNTIIGCSVGGLIFLAAIAGIVLYLCKKSGAQSNETPGSGVQDPAESDPLNGNERPSPPVGPVKFSNIKKTTLTLSWQPSRHDGGFPLTAYHVEMRDTQTSCWTLITTVTPDILTYCAQNLKEQHKYVFRIFAENDVGKSDALTSDIVKSPFDKPGKLEGPLVYTNLTHDAVTMSWKPPLSDRGTPITNYIIESRDTRRTTWSKLATVDADKLTYKAEGLSLDQEYLFRISAVNAEGQGPTLDSLDRVKPQKPLEKPGPPQNVKTLPVTEGKVTVIWKQPNFDGGSRLTGYRIKLRENGGQWREVDNVESYDRYADIYNLDTDVEYMFAVAAENKVGVGEAAETDSPAVLHKKAERPSSPVGPIKFSDIDKTMVTLSWQHSKSDGGSPLTGYIVEMKEVTQFCWTEVDKVGPTITSYCAQNLKEKKDIVVRVIAKNAVGKSEPTQSDTVTPKSPYDLPGRPVGPIVFSDITKDSVSMAWKPPTNDGGTPITGYVIEVKANRAAWRPAGNVAGQKLTFTMDDAVEGTSYFFRVSAVNMEGQGPALESTDSATPMRPLIQQNNGNIQLPTGNKDTTGSDQEQDSEDGVRSPFLKGSRETSGGNDATGSDQGDGAHSPLVEVTETSV